MKIDLQDFAEKLYGIKRDEHICFHDLETENSYIAECFYRNDVLYLLVTMYGVMVEVYNLNDYYDKDVLLNDIQYDFGISDEVEITDNNEDDA